MSVLALAVTFASCLDNFKSFEILKLPLIFTPHLLHKLKLNLCKITQFNPQARASISNGSIFEIEELI